MEQAQLRGNSISNIGDGNNITQINGGLRIDEFYIPDLAPEHLAHGSHSDEHDA